MVLGCVQAAYLGLQPSRRCPLNAKEGRLDWGLPCIKQDGERQDTWVSPERTSAQRLSWCGTFFSSGAGVQVCSLQGAWHWAWHSANQNHYEVPFHTSQNGCDPKVYK